jgi:hypothetical protein
VIWGGTYYINATLVSYSGVVVEAMGGEVVIQAVANLNAPLITSYQFSLLTGTGNNSSGIHNFTWRGRITFDGNAQQQSVPSAAAVQLYAYNFRIDTLTIRNCLAVDGIYTEWGALGTPVPDASMEAAISMLRVHNNTLTGVGWHNRGPHDSMADKVIIHNNTTNAIGYWCEAAANTIVAIGSNGINVNTFTGIGVLNVVSVMNFPVSGSFTVPTTGGTATITYTGTSGGNSFTGCTFSSGNAGTMTTGGAVTGPQWSGSAVLIDEIHVWGSHSLAVQADTRVELRNAQLEGATIGMLLVRGGDISVDGRCFYLASGSGYGIQLGDSVNQATGCRLLGVLLENFTGGAAAQAALNIVNSASGKYNCHIYKTNNNQQVYGTRQANEKIDITYAGQTTFPSVAAGAGAGGSPPTPTVSNATDNKHSVNMGTGTVPATGTQVTITFAQSKPGGGVIPVIVPANAATAACQPYVSAVSNSIASTIGWYICL